MSKVRVSAAKDYCQRSDFHPSCFLEVFSTVPAISVYREVKLLT